MIDKLPIGSVIELKSGKKYMIVGTSKGYTCIEYPIGVDNEYDYINVNKEDIKSILHVGYLDNNAVIEVENNNEPEKKEEMNYLFDENGVVILDTDLGKSITFEEPIVVSTKSNKETTTNKKARFKFDKDGNVIEEISENQEENVNENSRKLDSSDNLKGVYQFDEFGNVVADGTSTTNSKKAYKFDEFGIVISEE